MTLMRWSPRRETWDPFSRLAEIQNEMSQLFDTSLRQRNGGLAYVPPMDVSVEGDNILVRAELPGLRKEDVKVSLEHNLLTISGEKKEETQKEGNQYYFQERSYGAFSRSVELPTTVDAKKITATFKDGVLHVTLPKSEEAKPRQIEVKVN